MSPISAWTLAAGRRPALSCGRRASYFFLNDPATPEIYTTEDSLSLHDALPIFALVLLITTPNAAIQPMASGIAQPADTDRKSTRLNSSHPQLSRMPSSA